MEWAVPPGGPSLRPATSRCRDSAFSARMPASRACQALSRACRTTSPPCETTSRLGKSASRPRLSASRACETTSRPCETVSRACQAVSRPCKSTSRPCKAVSRACQTTFRACKSISRDGTSLFSAIYEACLKTTISAGHGSRWTPLDPAARAGVSSRRLPSGNMKPIAPLHAVLPLAVIVTGCETTRKESCCGTHLAWRNRREVSRLSA